MLTATTMRRLADHITTGGHPLDTYERTYLNRVVAAHGGHLDQAARSLRDAADRTPNPIGGDA